VDGVEVAPAARQRSPRRSLEGNRNKSGDCRSDKARRLRLRRGRDQQKTVGGMHVLALEYPRDKLDWKVMALKVDRCGQLGVWGCSECGGEVGRKVFYCKNRLCPGCAQRRAELMARKVVPLLETMQQPVHMVLTVKNRQDLAAADKHLRSSFQRLRDRVAFVDSFKGGLVFEETTHSLEGWHAHLHIIADGRMEQAELSRLWQEVTGDSYIVWIQAIGGRNRKKVLNEAVKYPCKIGDIVGDPELIYEWLHYFWGRRVMWAWGSMYNVQDQVEVSDDELEQDIADTDTALSTCPLCGAHKSLQRRCGWIWQYSAVAVSGGWWIVVDT